MKILKAQFDSNKLNNLEFLRLNKTSGKINSRLAILKYRDKDTKQIIIYLPSLEISSYGETEIKANKMLTSCLVEYFDFLLKSSFEKIGKELSKLGWKHDKFRKKEFSRAFVDIDGNLKNFNAVNNKVELSLLESNF